MNKESFIKFIESKGFEKSHLPGNPHLKYTVNIWLYDDHWDLIADEEVLNIEYASLQYPTRKADATEFFRILGI